MLSCSISTAMVSEVYEVKSVYLQLDAALLSNHAPLSHLAAAEKSGFADSELHPFLESPLLLIPDQ